MASHTHYVFTRSVIIFNANTPCMKRSITLLTLVALLFIVYSCNSGDYDADPNVNGQNNNYLNGSTVCANAVITDTVCSCTDSISSYINNELYSWAMVEAEHFAPPSMELAVTAYYGFGQYVLLDLKEYSGPGTYAVDMTYINQIDVNTTSGISYSTMNADADHCPAGKIVVTSDDGTFVKGTFYGILWNDDRTASVNVKGGQFTARLRY